MSVSRLRTALVLVAALALAAILVWSAGTGPSRLVGNEHDRSASSGQTQRPRTGTSTDDGQDARVTDGGDRSRRSGDWYLDLATLLVLLASLVVLATVARGLLRWASDRMSDRVLDLDLEPLPTSQAGRESMAEGHRRQLGALREGEVRNGIVECWVLLEEAAERAGVPRGEAETSSEFVVRFLRTLDVDPRPVGALAALFREARFSSHDLAEDSRDRAVTALEAIHADLAHAGAR